MVDNFIPPRAPQRLAEAEAGTRCLPKPEINLLRCLYAVALSGLTYLTLTGLGVRALLQAKRRLLTQEDPAWHESEDGIECLRRARDPISSLVAGGKRSTQSLATWMGELLLSPTDTSAIARNGPTDHLAHTTSVGQRVEPSSLGAAMLGQPRSVPVRHSDPDHQLVQWMPVFPGASSWIQACAGGHLVTC
jgi:hypothetical protein